VALIGGSRLRFSAGSDDGGRSHAVQGFDLDGCAVCRSCRQRPRQEKASAALARVVDGDPFCGADERHDPDQHAGFGGCWASEMPNPWGKSVDASRLGSASAITVRSSSPSSAPIVHMFSNGARFTVEQFEVIRRTRKTDGAMVGGSASRDRHQRELPLRRRYSARLPLILRDAGVFRSTGGGNHFPSLHRRVQAAPPQSQPADDDVTVWWFARLALDFNSPGRQR
jgi:hypothetical protein